MERGSNRTKEFGANEPGNRPEGTREVLRGLAERVVRRFD